MNLALWIMAGGVLGWVGYVILRANKLRGVKISVMIGAVGGFLGGHFLAPMLGAAETAPNDFSLFSLVAALATAAACLAIADVFSNPFGL
jgi:uncharacterized membrane protein YeaQ/YmgE (transglycosylase-associated protein family)